MCLASAAGAVHSILTSLATPVRGTYVCTYAHGPAWVDEAGKCLKVELSLSVAVKAEWSMCGAM